MATKLWVEQVQLENFRGVARLDLHLDAVTTIIGEHHCGKSSLVAAIACVLDPSAGANLPAFTLADFHRPPQPGKQPADRLSITIVFRRAPDNTNALDDLPPEIRALEQFAIRVEAHRPDAGQPTSSLHLLDRPGSTRRVDNPAAILAALRRRTPALVMRWLSAGANNHKAPRDDKLHALALRIDEVFQRLSQPGAVQAHDIDAVMTDLRQAASTLLDRLEPAPTRPRSVDELADTPQLLQTDIRAAMAPDAGPHRHVALLLMVGAMLGALPPDGLAPDADPILLFDDIELNLHPIWMAAVCSLATSLPLRYIITTHSSEVLAWTPLRSLRRLTPTDQGVIGAAIGPRTLSLDELRRIAYHLRMCRGASFFARCWVFVEGETEAWLVPEFARLCGIDFPVEGIRCVEFAQCGIAPLIKLANALRIGWVLIADGDRAGQGYVDAARSLIPQGRDAEHIVMLNAHDMEHYLFMNGYGDAIRAAAKCNDPHAGDRDARLRNRIIRDAVHRLAKPGLALAILEAANTNGAPAVPPALRQLAHNALTFAQRGSANGLTPRDNNQAP